MSLSARNGIEDFCHTVADIVSNNILDKQGRQKYTDNRVHQKQPVTARYVKLRSQYVLYLMDEPLQQLCGYGCTDADDKTQQEDELARAKPFVKV